MPLRQPVTPALDSGVQPRYLVNQINGQNVDIQLFTRSGLAESYTPLTGLLDLVGSLTDGSGNPLVPPVNLAFTEIPDMEGNYRATISSSVNPPAGTTYLLFVSGAAGSLNLVNVPVTVSPRLR